MNIVICGAGEVGRHSAEVLSPAGHNITLIDQDPKRLAEIDEAMDIRSLVGNGTQADVLLEAGTSKADLFIGATNIDEINLLAASIATAVGCERSIARVHHSAYYEAKGLNYADHLGIDHLVCPEFTTAQAIAATLRSPGSHAVENFAKGAIEMQSITVSENAKAAGVALKDLKLPASTLVAAVERSDDAFLPVADTKVMAGDIVTLIGESKTFEKTIKLFKPEAGGRLKVMVMGGSTQGVWLCRELRNRNFAVRLFVQRVHRAQELAEKLPWVTLINGDVINSDILLDERVDQVDAFVACTDDEETNILAAARAKSMGAKSAIAVLQRPTYLHLIGHIGLDHAFSPRSTAVNEIERLLSGESVRQLAPLAEGIADVYEIRVPSLAKKVIGIPLKDVEFPARTIIAAISRGETVFVPGADDTIKPGDMVVVIAPSECGRELKKIFGG
ncbi:trk system potassium uptake protein TrkA [Algisphaera agarilytica]|uniref:Trk system potassium uptake protein TrkA n=2 Tax=Algisphaera agarilytica TaxID=1385975 RepID=A0A7X0H7G3_9BACT|nr:trk system potassium uptake protein TrkA [Algisphaera agarilytica]